MHTALPRVFVCVFVCVLVCVCEWKEELICYIVSIIYNVKGIVNSFFSLALICCCARVPACKFEKKIKKLKIINFIVLIIYFLPLLGIFLSMCVCENHIAK